MISSTRDPAEITLVAVDWSGARVGAKKKLWLGEASGGRLRRLECGRERSDLIRLLCSLAEQRQNLVVGIDFAFSLPAWFLFEHGLTSAFELWDLVARDGEAWLSACAPPFWGRKGTRRPASDPERPLFRRTESEYVPIRGISPKSPFQLAGPGSVGTGSLRGMPHLTELRARGFAIWPFEAPRFPLVVEIYPRDLTGPLNKTHAGSRQIHLTTHFGDQPRELIRRAGASDDAFDAAVSALRMGECARSFRELAADDDPVYGMEGRIWRPVQDPMWPAVGGGPNGCACEPIDLGGYPPASSSM